jgi:hypothetical protein
MDEFGPLNLQPRPGRPWAERGGKHKDPSREPRPKRRAAYTRPHGDMRAKLLAWLPCQRRRPILFDQGRGRGRA